MFTDVLPVANTGSTVNAPVISSSRRENTEFKPLKWNASVLFTAASDKIFPRETESVAGRVRANNENRGWRLVTAINTRQVMIIWSKSFIMHHELFMLGVSFASPLMRGHLMKSNGILNMRGCKMRAYLSSGRRRSLRRVIYAEFSRSLNANINI